MTDASRKIMLEEIAGNDPKMLAELARIPLINIDDKTANEMIDEKIYANDRKMLAELARIAALPPTSADLCIKMDADALEKLKNRSPKEAGRRCHRG